MTDPDRSPESPTASTPPAARGPAAHSRRWRWIGLAGFLVVAVAGVAVWYFVFRDTAPPKVDIDTAAESVERDSKPSNDSTATTAPGAATGLDDTWTVDPTVGEFNPSAGVFTSAFVGYRVNEELAGLGAKTAFGRTHDVTGSLTIDGTVATGAEFTADLTTLQSDDSRRDGQLRNQGIQTSRFPTATFKLTQPVDFGKVPTDESTVSVNATGELTLHGVTRTVTIPLDAKLVGDTIVVTSLFDVTFADYDITKPSSVAVLSIEDTGIMEVQLFFTRS